MTDADTPIICNGFKRPQYVENIANLINSGFTNTIPVIDNKQELDLLDIIEKPCQIGIRIAAEEEPKFDFYTSRLGIRYNDIIPYYKDCQESNFGPTWHTVNDDMAHIDRNTMLAVGQTLIQVIYSEK